MTRYFRISLILTVISLAGLLAVLTTPTERITGAIVIDPTGIHTNATVYEEPWWYWPASAMFGTFLLIGSGNMVLAYWGQKSKGAFDSV